jgi:hypothetical protein
VQIFFPEFNISLYDKNSESDYFFFPPPKSKYFFQQNGRSLKGGASEKCDFSQFGKRQFSYGIYN